MPVLARCQHVKHERGAPQSAVNHMVTDPLSWQLCSVRAFSPEQLSSRDVLSPMSLAAASCVADGRVVDNMPSDVRPVGTGREDYGRARRGSVSSRAPSFYLGNVHSGNPTRDRTADAHCVTV